MASFGLFTRVDRKAAPEPKKGKPGRLPTGFSAAQLHELGLKGVRQMNPHAVHPEMPASGSKRPLVYVLGEAPGETEDEKGVPFVGKAGRFLRDRLPRGYEDITRFNNVVGTRPPKNRLPNAVEVECFRPSVVEDILRTKPRAILALGAVAVQWAIGDTKQSLVEVVRGRRFAGSIGGHPVWIFPATHPSWVMRTLDDDVKVNEVPAKEWGRAFEWDIERCFSEADSLDAPKIENPDHLWDGVEIVEGGADGVKKVRTFLDWLHRERKRAAFDVESNRLRPYSKGYKLLSVSVGTYERCLAFAVDHPQAKWTRDQRNEVMREFLAFLRSMKGMTGHNTGFDLEHLLAEYGLDVLHATFWHCTRVQSYYLDERRGGQSLNFRCLQMYGLDLKSKSKTTAGRNGLFGADEEEIDRAQLEFTRLKDVLDYNALDSKYTDKLDTDQEEMLRGFGLWKPYRMHTERIPALANAQRTGLPVDVANIKAFHDDYAGKIANVRKAINDLPIIRKFTDKYGPFNPDSPQQMTTVLRDMLKHKEGQRGEKYSTDKSVLEAIAGKCDLAKQTLKLRNMTKLKGTYIDRLMPDHPKTHVYPDGRIHTSFNSTDTATGRTSSNDPNVQNFPKRKDADIRRVIVAPTKEAGLRWLRWLLAEKAKQYKTTNLVLLSADHGQIEYRVIGMASKDPVVVKSLWDDYDVHGEWAKRVQTVCPHQYDKHVDAVGDEKAFKALRNELKNSLVFPRFFGSSWFSIARNNDWEDKQRDKISREFDDKFKGVIKWQQSVGRFYEKHGYVETLTGRLRRYPLSWNMIINTPIQGTASDIVVDGMNRLCDWSEERDMPWLSPVMNIHDDLTLIVPADELETTIPIVATAMLASVKVFDFINVPLNIEMATGPNWAEMKEIGKFQSNKWKHAA